MAELTSIDRTITEAMLNDGEIQLGPEELGHLGLPEHSEDLMVRADDEPIQVHWAAARRRLTGEALADYLQESGRIGGLVRLVRQDQGVIQLVVLNARPTTFDSASFRPRNPLTGPVDPAGLIAGLPRQRRKRGRAGARYRLRQRDEYDWQGRVGFLKEARAQMLSALQNSGWDPADAVRLRLEGERLVTLDQFDELLAIDVSNIDHMAHQEAAARTVLARMNGRGILADEVGLGKTIEGGLVIKELLLRGLVQRILIICPSQLREQWKNELKEKFDEDFTVLATGKDPRAFTKDRLILTPQLAMANARQFTESFDLVIIDEAHRMAGKGSRRTREVLGELIAQAPRALFLTATPVQNDLFDLYRLIELLRPGTFASQRDFSSRFIDESDPRRPVNTKELRKLISSVIIRTTRAQAGVDKVHRMPPQDIGFEITPPERRLYDLIMGALRDTMTEPADSMRRRQLALRLTASPRAVSRSAERMAHKHPNPATCEVLRQIADLAGGIRHTAREQACLSVLKPWLIEHGQALIFTQHTDTLEGILALLAAEDITATGFHGSMSHIARADSVSAFKAGQVQVLVSTDAGAEGLNLQVANCVLNYDLPWNPMRVEQRIGRVHRATQKRDIHIANLFARNTVDESVYRLLHDKLAMFELLFGQVVTVLGELAGPQDATMETRVLEALYAKSDASMQQQLDELGDQLEAARGRATEMMTADSGLSEWLAETTKKRDERRAEPEAEELRPAAAAKRAVRRQQELQQLIVQFLELTGSPVIHSAPDFISVQLSAKVSAELDGRDNLHLAFTNAALDNHPDAELCVVGSESFDDVLRALREHGDLTGTVRALPDLPQDAQRPHVPEIRLIQRLIEPADDWSAVATFRTQDTASSGTQRLATVQVGEPPAEDSSRVALGPGAPLPRSVRAPGLLQAVQRQAARDLRDQLAEVEKTEQQEQLNSKNRMLDNLRNQLAECEKAIATTISATLMDELFGRRKQLSRAIEAASGAQVADGGTELRAELLALEVHGSPDLLVHETWEHHRGVSGVLTFAWTGSLNDHRPLCAATGVPIDTLALCAGAHFVDEIALLHCSVCDLDGCSACGDIRVLDPCPVCRRQACASCRPTGGLCLDCARPERDVDLDTTDELGWRLGGGATVLLGTRHAVLVGTDGLRTQIIPDQYFYDEASSHLRALASRLQLSPSAGLGHVGPATSALGSAEALWSRSTDYLWWTQRPGTTDPTDELLFELLPELPRLLVGPGHEQAESDSSLGALLTDLRTREQPPTSPMVTAVSLTIEAEVTVDDGLLSYREMWCDAAGEPMEALVEQQSLVPSDHPVSPFMQAVASTRVGPVDIRIARVHRSFIVELSDGVHTASVFVGGVPGATADGEQLSAQLVVESGLDLSHVLLRHPWPGVSIDDVRFSTAAPKSEVVRHSSNSWHMLNSDDGLPLTTLDAAPGEVTDAAWASSPEHRDLLPSLTAMQGDLEPVSIAPLLFVDEVWTSPRGTATRGYLICPATPLDENLAEEHLLVGPGRAAWARLDDGRPGDATVDVDEQGHLYDPDHAVGCPVCDARYGRCCDNGLGVADCGTCNRPACRRCRLAEHAAIQNTTCQRCEDFSCGDCGRDLPLLACWGCRRETCAACSAGSGLCHDCEHPIRAADLDTESEIGWRLGDDSSLLVGRGHAIQIHGYVTPITIVPDTELNDPIRKRIRALADRIGLSPGAGLVLAAPAGDPASLVSGAVWGSTQLSHWWTRSPSDSEEADVDPIVAAQLPDLTGPPALGESETGLSTLLTSLRAQKAPPAPANVTAVPFTVAQRVDIEDGQFEYREYWRDCNDDPVVAVLDRQDLVHEDEADGDPARPSAGVKVGPVSVRVTRIHRSFRADLTDARHSSSVFLPGAIGATQQAEEHLARLVFDAGLDSSHVLVRHPWLGVAPESLHFSEPAAATRVARDVTTVWAMLESSDGEALIDVPGENRPLPALVYAKTVVRDDKAWTLQWRHQGDQPVAIAPVLAVEEYWVSPRGSATRSYLISPAPVRDSALAEGRLLVLPGHPVLATFDDGSPSDRAVSIDSQGHLYDAAKEVACPVCDQAYGACCSDGVGIADCDTCTRPACGQCRETQHPEIADTKCERCGDESCSSCGRNLPLTACPGCRRSTCSACHPDASLCHDCGKPCRATELDRVAELGWKLGGGSSLLVGAHHAVLLHPELPPDLLIPEGDVDGPARPRLRALANRLGLTPSAGLIWMAPRADPAQLTLGAIWSQTAESVWWGHGENGDDCGDPVLLALLPDLPVNVARAEQVTELGDLLRRLRLREPAPLGPTVAAMPFTIARRLDFEDGYLQYRELWRDGDADPTEAVIDRKALVPSFHTVPETYRPLAYVRVGPLEVTFSGVHQSYVMEIKDGEETETHFLPGSPGLTLTAEEALARNVAEAGLPADRIIVQPTPAASYSETRYATPAPDTQVRRAESVVRTLMHLHQHSAPPHQATSISDAEGLLQKVSQLDAALVRVAFTHCTIVREEWYSDRGTARREYVVAEGIPVNLELTAGRSLVQIGEPAYPQLDDGSQAGTSISVDRRGHLYDSARAHTCPVCDEIYGACCGSDGMIVPCRTCDRPACGICREAIHPAVRSTTCQRCGDFSCVDCGRDLPLADCGLCERAVCRACLIGGRCETCASLRPATAAELQELPHELAAVGLTVLIAHDQTETIALLSGAHRQEIARFSGATLRSWQTVSGDSPRLLQIRLAAAHLSGQGDVDVRYLTAIKPGARSDVLVLHEDVATQLRWSVALDSVKLAGTADPPGGAETAEIPDAVLDQLLVHLAPTEFRVPDAASPSAAERARHHLRGLPLPARPTSVTFGLVTRRRSESVTSNGLLRRIVVGEHCEEHLVGWQLPDATPEWVTVQWSPDPEVLAIATSETYTAVVAALGAHMMLGLHQQGMQSRWMMLVNQPDALQEAMLGQVLLQKSTLLSARRFTAPSTIRGPQIMDATRTQRRAESNWTYLEQTASEPGDQTRHALAEHAPGIAPRAPIASESLSPALHQALVRRFANRQIERLRADMGLEVHEQWRLFDGTVVPIRYLVPAGETDGYLTDAATGVPLQELQACRAAHLVQHVDQCAYCATPTCARCSNPVQACPICQVSVCGGCSRDGQGRCGACAALRPMNLLRRMRLSLPKGASAWHGDDDLSEVTVTVAAGTLRISRLTGADETSVTVDGQRAAELKTLIEKL